MRISNIERWILFSDNGFIKYFLWEENDIVKVVNEHYPPFILEFDSSIEAVAYMNKKGKEFAKILNRGNYDA